MKSALHIHSTYSDGIFTPFELVELAKKNKIDLISITDHDTIGAYDEKLDIPFIKGIELSTYYENQPVHLLGYFLNEIEKEEEFKKYLEKIKTFRILRTKKMLKKLKKIFNIDLTFEEIENHSPEIISRPLIASLITEKYGYRKEEIFKEMIGDNCPAYEKISKITTQEGIEFLHKHHAIVILAHPFFIKNIPLEKIIELGVDGIEVNYPAHTKKYTKKILKIAKEHDLYFTTGSDFHGNNTNKVNISDYTHEFNDYNKIIKKVD